MAAEIINVADELLTGELLNTNASYLADKLQEYGIELCYQTSVVDDPDRLKKVLKEACSRSSIIIITGLGHRVDDITKEMVATIVNKKMTLHKPTLKKLKKYLITTDRSNPQKTPRLNKSTYKVAMYPEGSEVLENPVGITPGIVITKEDKKIILLPGERDELRSLVEGKLIPYLRRYKEKNLVVKRHILRTWGLGEPEMREALQDLMGENKNPLIRLRLKEEEVEVSIVAKGGSFQFVEKLIEEVEEKIRERLGDHVYATGDISMEKVVGLLLTINKKTIAVAESVTGGLISKKITEIPGSSKYFLEGMITYSNDSKTRHLEVPKELIERYGSVSKEVCEAMAVGIRRLSSSDIGLATTGIAGPSGATKNKPVGITYIGLATEKGCEVEEHKFIGTRTMVRKKASQAALDMVRRYLIS